MTDRCKRCGRPTEGNYPEACLRGRLARRDDIADCDMFAAGRRAGMREAIGVAKELVFDDCSEGCGRAYGKDFDWTDVESEIARREGK